MRPKTICKIICMFEIILVLIQFHVHANQELSLYITWVENRKNYYTVEFLNTGMNCVGPLTYMWIYFNKY